MYNTCRVCYVEMCASFCNGSSFIFSRHSFEEDSYLEFSHIVQDRIIGTSEGTAHVSYDFSHKYMLKSLSDVTLKAKTKTYQYN